MVDIVVTIFDGLIDTTNRSLANIVVMSPLGPYFLREIDALRDETAEFVADKILEEIKVMGPLNIMQVITDNGCLCKAIAAIIRERYEPFHGPFKWLIV